MSPYRTVSELPFAPRPKEKTVIVNLGWLKCEVETIYGEKYIFDLSGTGPNGDVYEEGRYCIETFVETANDKFRKILKDAKEGGWVIVPNEREEAIPFHSIKKISKIEQKEIMKTWIVTEKPNEY